MLETGILLKIIKRAWNEAKVPRDCKIGIIVSIHKKSDNRECINYRRITLLGIIMRLYEQVLEKRLRQIIEPTNNERF